MNILDRAFLYGLQGFLFLIIFVAFFLVARAKGISYWKTLLILAGFAFLIFGIQTPTF